MPLPLYSRVAVSKTCRETRSNFNQQTSDPLADAERDASAGPMLYAETFPNGKAPPHFPLAQSRIQLVLEIKTVQNTAVPVL